MSTELIITEELALQLNLLSYVDTKYVSDVILALFEHINDIKQDRGDMPQPVRIVFDYWTTTGKIKDIIGIKE